MTISIHSTDDTLTLPELEAEARRLNDDNEESPRVHVEDRDTIVTLAGLNVWADALALRIADAYRIRDVSRELAATGWRRLS